MGRNQITKHDMELMKRVILLEEYILENYGNVIEINIRRSIISDQDSKYSVSFRIPVEYELFQDKIHHYFSVHDLCLGLIFIKDQWDTWTLNKIDDSYRETGQLRPNYGYNSLTGRSEKG